MNQSSLPDKKRKWKVVFFTSKPYVGVAQKEKTSMATVQLFSQIARLIDLNIVKAAAKKFGTDKGSHKIDTLAHLLALVFCEIADCQSLRDVHKGLTGVGASLNHLGMRSAPSRNGLSHQNAQRDGHVFEYIYKKLHQKLMGQQNFACRFRPHIRASRVLLLDSSTVTLCLNLFK